MDENAAILLIEVLDGAGIRVLLDGSRDGTGELFVREGYLSELGVEGAGDESTEEVPVCGVAVGPAGCGVHVVGVVVLVVDGEDSGVFQGSEELRAIGGDIAEGLMGEEVC